MGELPSGRVTFCFTDIEGSTRLARALADGWRPVLERHNELLRAVWRDHAGVEVKTEGDAFFVVFADPADAVAAAVEAQRALAAEAWPDAGEVRVRIGMHTGVAEVSDGDYVGFEVHKAARVSAAAHGGQVLLSGATADAVAGRLPEGCGLRALGEFSLKDFEEGERLFQVTHAALATDIVAPGARPVAAHNLPLLRTSFVGRDVERAEVAKLCEHHPLVTVLGPGGAGKTRLALEVGRMVATDYPDGVWAVLLAGEPAGADVASVVAASLGIGDVGGMSAAQGIAAALQSKRLLLVLDNCEHVLESVAAVADTVLATCPEVVVLATSRQPLGVDGERVWAMPMLATPTLADRTRAQVIDTEAVQLFAERAAAADPRFVLTDGNAETVARICRAVEGLPLALELAAAATRSTPLATLATRLDDGTSLLRSKSSTHAPRQRTIDDLIGWSYDLLEPVQQAVFRRLPVFRGGWTAEAAEAVCAGGIVDRDAVLPALADLGERSLVVVDSEDRYRMLVLIRGFAESRLRDAGEEAAAQTAHLAHFVSVAREITEAGSAAPASLRWSRSEMENLRHAFDRAVAARDATALELLYGFAESLLQSGHYRVMDDAFAAVVDIFRARPLELARILANRSQLARVLGDRPLALELSDTALAAAADSGSPDLIAAAAAQKAFALAESGELAAAHDCAATHLDPRQSPARRATLLEVQALSLEGLKEDAAALPLRLEAARLYEETGQAVRAAAMRLQAGEHLAARDAAAALVAISAALALADDAGVPRLRAQAILKWCVLTRMGVSGAAELAVDGDIDDAVEIADTLGEPLLITNARTERALLRARAGDLAGAADDVARVLPTILPLRHAGSSAEALTSVAVALANDPAAPALAAAALAMGAEDQVLLPQLRQLATGHQGAAPTMDEALLLAIERLGARSTV